MSNLKYRLMLIAALCVASLVALFPRNQTTQVRGKDGNLHPFVSRHVPLQKGLDLQGGTYFALEIDDSKQTIAVADRKDAMARAVKTVRTRIDGIGVAEAVVQTAGADRIVVQIPGIEDPARARQMVEEQAFLEFLITDKTGSLEKALPRLDQVIKQRGLSGTTVATNGDTAASAKSLTGQEGLSSNARTATPAPKPPTARKDTPNLHTVTAHPSAHRQPP